MEKWEPGALLEMGRGNYIEVLPDGAYGLLKIKGQSICKMYRYKTLGEALEAMNKEWNPERR